MALELLRDFDVAQLLQGELSERRLQESGLCVFGVVLIATAGAASGRRRTASSCIPAKTCEYVSSVTHQRHRAHEAEASNRAASRVGVLLGLSPLGFLLTASSPPS